MPKVLIAEEPRKAFDLSSTLEFGDVVFLSPRSNERRPSVFNTNEYVERVRDRLVELAYEPGTDYFALVGSSIHTAVCLLAVSHFAPGPVNVLLFDAASSRYVARRVDPAVIHPAPASVSTKQETT